MVRKTNVTISIPVDIIETVKELAKKESRSISSMYLYLINKGLEK